MAFKPTKPKKNIDKPFYKNQRTVDLGMNIAASADMTSRDFISSASDKFNKGSMIAIKNNFSNENLKGFSVNDVKSGAQDKIKHIPEQPNSTYKSNYNNSRQSFIKSQSLNKSNLSKNQQGTFNKYQAKTKAKLTQANNVK